MTGVVDTLIEVLRDTLPHLVRLAQNLFQCFQTFFTAGNGFRVAAAVDKVFHHIFIRWRVEQYGARLFSVASGAADFLRVRIDADGQSGVHDQSHVGTINAQTEGVRSHDDRFLFRQKVVLHASTLAAFHFAVISLHRITWMGTQPFGRALDIFDAWTVDDRRSVLAVLAKYIVQQSEPCVLQLAGLSGLIADGNLLDIDFDIFPTNRKPAGAWGRACTAARRCS